VTPCTLITSINVCGESSVSDFGGKKVFILFCHKYGVYLENVRNMPISIVSTHLTSYTMYHPRVQWSSKPSTCEPQTFTGIMKPGNLFNIHQLISIFSSEIMNSNNTYQQSDMCYKCQRLHVSSISCLCDSTKRKFLRQWL
jgi:hypothetical protein